MSLESLIDDSGQFATISIESPNGQSVSQDALGGADRSGQWPVIAVHIPCLLNNKSSPLMGWPGRNDARAQVQSTRIYFYFDPTPSGFTTRMRITVSAPGSSGDMTDIGTYQVIGTGNPNSMNRIYQIDVERVRTP
jgi:hypothetical protein